MHPFLFSEEQSSVIHCKSSITNVRFKNEQTALHTLFLRLTENIIQGKSSWVVIPDKQMQDSLVSMLKSAGMGQALLQINLSKAITEEDLQTLRQKWNHQTPAEISDDPASAFLFAQTETKLNAFFECIYRQPVLENNTWRNILDWYLELENHNSDPILHAGLDRSAFNFSLDELESIKKGIQEAVYLYQREFEITNVTEAGSNLKISKNVYERVDTISYDLFTFIEIARQLKNKYYRCLQDLEMSYMQEAASWSGNILQQTGLLRHRMEHYIEKYKSSPAGVFSALSQSSKIKEKEKTTLLGEFVRIQKSLLEKKLAVQQISPKEVEPCLKNLEQFEEIVQRWTKQIHAGKEVYIKSVNRLNAGDHRLVALEDELQYLLQGINASDIFESTFEINTLSFKKQVSFISNLVYDLEMMMLHIQKNLPYYQWLSFLSTLDDRQNTIIKTLRKFDVSEWLTVFESWYYFELLSMHLETTPVVDGKHFYDAESLYVNMKNYEISKSISNLTKQYKSFQDALKATDPEWYREIFKKSKTGHPVTWKYAIEKNTMFFLKSCPILITDSDDMHDLPPNVIQDLMYLNPVNINPEILQNVDHIITFYPEDKTIPQPVKQLLSDPPGQIQQIVMVSMTEKLQLVRYLAEEMLQFDKTPAVFQLRHACIISFCSEGLHQEISHQLYDLGIKRLQNSDSPAQTIIGSMLDTDRLVFVLTENFLLNPVHHSERYLWQRSVMERLRQAGCRLINLETTDLFYNKYVSLDNLIHEIKQHNLPDSNIKNQLILEFN